MKVSQEPIALRLATTACPPPPSAQTKLPLDACKAILLLPRSFSVKVSQGPIALRLATTACPPPPSAQTK